MATANMFDRLMTVFFRSTLLDQHVGARIAPFYQFLERSLQDFSRNFAKSSTGYQHQLCSMLSKFHSAQDDALKKGIARLCTLFGGSVDAASIVTERTYGSDQLLCSGSLRPDATTGPSFSVTAGVGEL